eukprot:5085930-Amphidinium_carterae.2
MGCSCAWVHSSSHRFGATWSVAEGHGTEDFSYTKQQVRVSDLRIETSATQLLPSNGAGDRAGLAHRAAGIPAAFCQQADSKDGHMG